MKNKIRKTYFTAVALMLLSFGVIMIMALTTPKEESRRIYHNVLGIVGFSCRLL